MARYSYTQKCKYCGAVGLLWHKDDKWRLYGAVESPDGGFVVDLDAPHDCRAVRPAPGPAPVEMGPVAPAPVPSPAPAPVEASRAAKVSHKYITGKASWSEQLEGLLLAGARRILVVGPPGTGKSTTSAILAGRLLAMTGTAPRVTMTEGACKEDLLGVWRVQAGDMKFHRGPAVDAIEQGSGLVIDELERTSPEVSSLMYTVWDDKPEFVLPDNSRIVGHERYTVIGTSNSNVAVLPEPIVDRIEAVVLACTPHRDALPVDRALSGLVTGFYRSLDKSPYKWGRKPTLRPVRAFERLRASGRFEDSVLAELVFGEAGAEIVSALTTSGRTGTKEIE